MILAVWFRPLERESPFSSLKCTTSNHKVLFRVALLSVRDCVRAHTGPGRQKTDRTEGRGVGKKSRAGNSLWQQHGTQLKSYLNRMKRPGVSDSSRDEREEERREKISKWIGNQPSVIKRQTLKCRPAAARLIVWVTAIRRQLFSPHRPENWISIWELIQKHFTCAAPAGHSRCLAAMTSPIWQLSSYSQSSSLIPSREMKLSSSGIGLQRRSFTHTNSSKKRVENI
jgi:hypothetical protein